MVYMSTEDWLAICRAIHLAVGKTFPLCSSDVPELLDQIASGGES